MSTADLNGHDRASDAASERTLDERIAAHVSALDELLPALRAERDQVRARLDELNAREKAIIHATAALRGRSTPAPAAKTPKTTKTVWSPSEERLKQVFELYRAEGGPISPTQLAEKTPGIGTETVSKSVKILRERELLRVTGALRGGGSLYTVMDGAEWPS